MVLEWTVSTDSSLLPTACDQKTGKTELEIDSMEMELEKNTVGIEVTFSLGVLATKLP